MKEIHLDIGEGPKMSGGPGVHVLIPSRHTQYRLQASESWHDDGTSALCNYIARETAKLAQLEKRIAEQTLEVQRADNNTPSNQTHIPQVTYITGYMFL